MVGVFEAEVGFLPLLCIFNSRRLTTEERDGYKNEGFSLSKPAILALQDGTTFSGLSIGAEGKTTGEVVFNTAITGYQEILTDPSYCQQIVTLTYPHIGNTGTNTDDMESSIVYAAGLVIRDAPIIASNWRNEQTLQEFLIANNTIAITDIDTRKLTRILRENGAQSGCIMTGEVAVDVAINYARQFEGIAGVDLAKVVTTDQAYHWSDDSVFESSEHEGAFQTKNHHVVAYDYGVKQNILRILSGLDCHITVVPATMPAKEVLALNPDGVFLSNGPGDPEPCDYAIKAVQEILDTLVPVFGICLGHQILALASGAKTLKMKFGHHGANHPVQDRTSNRVVITSQNHGFAVDPDTLPENIDVTHTSLFDGSLQGIAYTDKPAYSFQGHPEASPGPHDVLSLFDRFIEEMTEYKSHRKNKTIAI